MAGTKLDKIDGELAKAREKLAEWQAKVKELEQKRQEEENTQIVSMVRALNLTPAQLVEFLQKPGPVSGTTRKETEDLTHEEK